MLKSLFVRLFGSVVPVEREATAEPVPVPEQKRLHIYEEGRDIVLQWSNNGGIQAAYIVGGVNHATSSDIRRKIVSGYVLTQYAYIIQCKWDDHDGNFLLRDVIQQLVNDDIVLHYANTVELCNDVELYTVPFESSVW